MKITLNRPWLMYAIGPIFMFGLCVLFETELLLNSFTALFSPLLLFFLIVIAAISPFWSTLASAAMGWIYLAYFVPAHLRRALDPDELLARNTAWFILMLATPLLIHFLRARLASTLKNQADEHERASQRLQASEARSRGLIEFAQDAFIGMDGGGRITDWNMQAERTFGWTSAEVLGSIWSDVIIPPRDRKNHETGLADFMETHAGPVRNRRVELTAQHRHGNEIPIEMTIYSLKSPSGLLFGSFLHDISERKRNEESLKEFSHDLEVKIEERTRELSKAYEQAQIANRLKDEFLATVSHEIRTPLGVILGYTDLLLQDDIQAADKMAFLRIIDRNAKSQMQLVTDLLDVSRIITGKLKFEQGTVDLSKAVAMAIDSINVAAAAKDIQIELDVDQGIGQIQGDASRIQQVLWNLLSNAVKFTPKNGRIRVSLRFDEVTARIVVADTGKGIDPAFLPYVFERFRQEDATTTRSFGGLGLGLSIVRHIVEAHGGTCNVSSEGVDRGSEFTIELPFAPVRAFANHSKIDGTQNEKFPLKDIHVLIVDDQHDNRTMLKLWLNRAGAIVTEADNANSAYTQFTNNIPDLFVSDISMPGQDGYELMQRIRTKEAALGIRVPSVAFTAHARIDEKQKALAAGFDVHVARPIEARALIQKLAELISSERILSEAKHIKTKSRPDSERQFDL